MDDLDIATALPGYEIGGELGRGSFGVVLAGRHRQLGREVAIKRLSSSLGEDPEIRRRFVKEARLLGGLDHPHVVPVYDFVESDGLLLLVMERLTGGTLADRLGHLTPHASCAVVLGCCAGLHHAHGRGVLHRDVKPDNLMFTADGTIKVTDFGIAKVVGGSETVMTKAGSVQGTPAYMAPEQVESLDVTPATDVYAAGTVLYELLAGTLPYPPASGLLNGLYQRVHEDPKPLGVAAPHIPSEIATVVDRAIARHPNERFDTAELLGEAVAAAASAAWGRAWLNGTGVPVLASGRIVAALTDEIPAVPVAPDNTQRVATTATHPATPDSVEDTARRGGPRSPGRPMYRLMAVLAVVAVLGGIAVALVLVRGGGTKGATRGATAPPTMTAGTTPPASSGVPPPTEGGTPTGDVLGRQVVPVKMEPCKAPTTGEGAAWQVGAVQVKDRMFDSAYYCNIFPGGRGSLDFVLGRSYRQLAMTIGFADKLSSSSAKATFEIIGDGKDYLTPKQTLMFGQVSNLVVNVVGVTRFTIIVSEVGVSGGNQAASVPVLAGPTLSPPS